MVGSLDSRRLWSTMTWKLSAELGNMRHSLPKRPPALYLSLTRECLQMPDLALAWHSFRLTVPLLLRCIYGTKTFTKNFAIEPYCHI